MDQQKLHRQKWRIWNQERQKQQMRKKLNSNDGIESYAANLIQKISDPFTKGNDREAKQVSKKITNQIESNVCSICLELMIPPSRHPIILFPCAHNICKDCLFQNPPHGQIKKNLKLKIDKCCNCREKIESYALNQSLMALICTYSNNKQLLEKQRKAQQEAERQEEIRDIDYQQIKIRYKILKDQQLSIEREVEKNMKKKKALFESIETLKDQKIKNDKQMEKLKEEQNLIVKYLTEKIEEMELLEKKLKQVRDKTKVVEKALVPLKKEKEKQELLQIARMLQRQ